jgi:hypothetical protein
MFHQFFGENMLRADVCNAVEELGQLLDHTGPVAASERNAARIFNADHLFFVTNGTSTSNKIVWHSTVAPGDIVVVDRNCHKSVLHSIIMTGAIPVFLMPTRNHYGIIGPIPKEEFALENIQKKIEANPFAAKVKGKKPRVLTITQSTYDGILYNVEEIKEMLDGKIDTLHFDEAWLPHAAFHDFYGDYHAIGADRPRCKESMVFSTQSTHKLLAGLSQASQILVQDSREPQARPRRVQRGLPDAHLDLAAVRDHRLVRRGGGDDGAAGRHALVEESIAEALDFRRAMRKVDEEFGADWWFKVWGPDDLSERASGARGLDAARRRALARLRRAGRRLQHARPDQGHGHHARARRRRRLRRLGHPGGDRHQVPRRARRHRREDRPLLLLHHVHHRHHQGPLEHAGDRAAAVQGRLRQEPAAVEGAARVRARASALRARRPARPVRQIHDIYKANDMARLTTEMYLSTWCRR